MTPPKPPRGLHRHGARLRALVTMPEPEALEVARRAAAEGLSVAEWISRAVTAKLEAERR